MRTLFLNPPSFEGFDGGAGSRWPASREIESYWYPVWLCYPAGMLPDSKVVDAPPHKISIEQTVAMAPCLQMGRIDVSAAIEEEFNAWYNTAYIPGYLAVPGCLGARRFVAVEGQPKYLTLYEFEHAKVPESEAWTRARGSNPWTRRMQPNLRHDEGSPGVYQRIYPK